MKFLQKRKLKTSSWSLKNFPIWTNEYFVNHYIDIDILSISFVVYTSTCFVDVYHEAAVRNV